MHFSATGFCALLVHFSASALCATYFSVVLVHTPRTDGQTDGQTDGRTDRRTDGRTDRQENSHLAGTLFSRSPGFTKIGKYPRSKAECASPCTPILRIGETRKLAACWGSRHEPTGTLRHSILLTRTLVDEQLLDNT